MRELLLTALFACVGAAPAIIAPYPHTLPISNGVTSLSSAPTISPGDIEAVAIDAQVKLANIARSLSDESKVLAELLEENQNQALRNANDLAKEKEEEALWAAEEKKWQALNEAQIAEAKLAGLIASKVDQDAANTEAKIETKIEATEMKNEEKTEIKREEMINTNIEANEVKNEENMKVESTGAEMPADAMKENAVEDKDATRKMADIDEALNALKSVSQTLMTIASGFNFQLNVAALPYSYQNLPGFSYQPNMVMVKEDS